ncbi:helix-turn-helix transcriptional regulator [Paenibacillus sp. KACC 21273]|uniref:helix-turn-helix domain-containing protein n=1 Tax=Paenibacillus sp. KACC 21273 TaxID=3025665 RepID=UPI00236714C3|nr:helix-turn-helix transcriptional regulator [Paenibacillus sp. KACC 21273]WDF52325.1 helix-turn-helix transcriptional regulator [Paenibacillus sp. KACC 21273]
MPDETILLKSLTGKIIKTLRIKNNMNQEDLAFACNVDRSYISMLERGLNEPSLTKIFDISKALNITPSQFVKMVELEHERMKNLEDM